MNVVLKVLAALALLPAAICGTLIAVLLLLQVYSAIACNGVCIRL